MFGWFVIALAVVILVGWATTWYATRPGTLYLRKSTGQLFKVKWVSTNLEHVHLEGVFHKDENGVAYQFKEYTFHTSILLDLFQFKRISKDEAGLLALKRL